MPLILRPRVQEGRDVLQRIALLAIAAPLVRLLVGSTMISEPPTRFVHRPSFRSPTGNVGCILIGGLARCDIAKRDWSPPPHPASCPNQVDFGQGLEVGESGKGHFVCAGDTARDPSAARLPYGTASQVGSFICVSRPSGMTCTNRHNGHGFFISVQSYRAF